MESCRGAAATGGGGRQWRHVHVAALAAALLLACGPSQAAVHLHESFDGLEADQWREKFTHSASSKHEGRFELAGAGDWDPADKALKMPEGNRRYGLTTLVASPLDPAEGLVLQYEARHGQGYTCGGSYLKLLTHAPGFTPEQLDEHTPYTIMFGPDLCGGQGKVHLILRHTNPLNGSVEERHLAEPPKPPQDTHSHVYTLTLTPPSKFSVLVDGQVGAEGDLLDTRTFAPPFQPPRTLDDPTDTRPDDWDEVEMIPDKGAVKPPDHDDREKIPDPGAKKPRGWLDDEPATIPNPAARKPAEWDDEEDGEWQPPHIPNPKCKKVGCGPWSPPLIRNIAFKGKWTPPLIKNPRFKGIWRPRQVPNPHYWEEEAPLAGIGMIGAIAVEVWTVDAGYTLDSLVLSTPDDPLPAQLREAWKAKHAREVAQAKDPKKAKADAKKKKDGKDRAGKDKDKDKPASNPLAKAILSAFRKPPLKAYRPYVRPVLKLLRQQPWLAYPLVLALPTFVLLALLLRPKTRAPASKRTARRLGKPAGDDDDQVPDLVELEDDDGDEDEEEEEPPHPPTYGVPPPPPKLDEAPGEGGADDEGPAEQRVQEGSAGQEGADGGQARAAGGSSGAGSGEFELVGAQDLPPPSGGAGGT